MLGHLQAHILRSHGRDFARHLFIRFTGKPTAVQKWIGEFAAKVTSAKQQLDQAARRDQNAAESGGVVFGFFLSAKGYQFLGLDIDCFARDAFRKGMKDQDDGFFEGVLVT